MSIRADHIDYLLVGGYNNGFDYMLVGSYRTVTSAVGEWVVCVCVCPV